MKTKGFPGGAMVKKPPANAGDACLIPGSGRSPGTLENPTDRGVWQAIVHGVTKSWTQLSTHTHTQKTTHLKSLNLAPLLEGEDARVWAH